MITTTLWKHAALTALLAGLGLISQTVRADYASYISGTSPVGWWGFNETGGTNLPRTIDKSGAYGAANNQDGGNLNLTYQGAGVNSLSDQPGYVTGSANRATYFDGTGASGAYARGISPYDLNITGAIYRYEPNGFSVEVWVKTDGLLVVDSERFISTREFGLGFEAGNGGSFGRLHFTTFGKIDYFGGQMPKDGKWHQIGVTFDGNNTVSFFVDGLPAGVSSGGNTGIRTALSPGANSINITHRNTDAQHFKGWVDEVVIWDHQRTAADFAASYVAAIPPHQGYAVNFAGTYAPPPAIGAPINVTGPLGPGHAHVSTWNNISLGRSVNAGRMIDQDHALTGANGAPTNTFHIHPGNPDGGNDGGSSPSQTNDFLRLFGGNIRLGDVYFDISMTPTFATYDLYVYGNGGKNYTLTTNGTAYGTKSIAGPNGSYFYEGNNFVLFTNCSGPFVLRAADSITGFSVVGPEVPGVPYQLLITSITYDANQDQLTLNWNSEPGALYTVENSQNLADWDNLTTGIPSGGPTTTRALDFPEPGTFYRIRKE